MSVKISSHNPPSSDQKGGKPANSYNGRKQTERKAGGQKGHKGTTLTKAEIEDKISISIQGLGI